MDSLPNNLILIAGFSFLAMAPFIAIMVTSYLKIVVVLYILRNAIGLQQAPPTLAINGLAIILSIYVMAPVGISAIDAFKAYQLDFSNIHTEQLYSAISDSIEPFRGFLVKHSSDNELNFFVQTTKSIWPQEISESVDKNNMLILLPSFVTSELKSAFQVGFLLYLPFIIIDLIVSNILLSMGMIMMSPIMVSLPFKILLFVLADGWTRLIHSLVISYQ